MRTLYVLIFLCLLLVIFVPNTLAEGDENENDATQYKWFFTLYGGVHVQPDLEHALTFQWKSFDNSYIAVAALAREFWRYEQWISLEAEGQVGKFFGDEEGWQFNGLLIARWNKFPWDKYVETSFAIGDGLSYNTEVSKVEEDDDEDAGKWLNYLLFELTLGLPEHPRWDLVYRIHHRSSVRGLIGAAGSNFVTLGVKYSF
jgi:hypothetical protein